jgi:hypothetical protein
MHRPSRRLTAALAVAACAAVAVIPAAASPAHVPGYTTDCPAATNLVAGTHWWRHRLAPGVGLWEGRHHGRQGYVRMHVLNVDVTDPHLAFRPVMRSVTSRHPLTDYSGQRALVAATNAGYFDMRTGAPIGPTVRQGRPLLGRTAPLGRAMLTSSVSTNVVGFGRDGLMESAHVSVAGEVVARVGQQPLAGLNTARPQFGITAYNSSWGRTPIVWSQGLVGRYVRRSFVSIPAPKSRRYRRHHRHASHAHLAPRSGYLLVARGDTAVHWLRSLRPAARVKLHVGMRSDAPTALRTAYAVGGRITANGVGLEGLTCPRGYPQPARTAIGYADGGRRLILVSVDDNMRTPLHGVDSVQLGRVMADLGASDAWLFDGGGSTTMVARMHPHARRLSLRTRTAERGQRPIPLGFGIFRR